MLSTGIRRQHTHAGCLALFFLYWRQCRLEVAAAGPPAGDRNPTVLTDGISNDDFSSVAAISPFSKCIADGELPHRCAV